MTSKKLEKLLLVEDNPGDVRLLEEMLKDYAPHNIYMVQVSSMGEAEAYLSANEVDIILLDLGLPDAFGLEAVRRSRVAAPRTPLVVLSGSNDESLAVQALQEGAQDYLIKGRIESRELPRALRYAAERKGIEDSLLAEKEQAQGTLHCMGDAVVCTDTSGNITFLNLVAERMTGWTLKEVEGRSLADTFAILDADARVASRSPMMTASARNEMPYTLSNSILVRKDGTEVAVEDSASPIHDHEGRATGAVIVFRDVTAARELASQMVHTAQHDLLTGLPNRILLNLRVEQAIAKANRRGGEVAILILDLDGFKHINDSLGHAVGDQLVQSVAVCLLASVSPVDTVSRQGGDEFVILLTNVAATGGAAEAAKRVLAAIAGPHLIDHRELHVSASMGVSLFPGDGTDAETLIMNADTAMYQAKEHGRQGFQFFRPAMNARAVERQSLEQDLRLALERKQLHLAYQPKVNLRTGAITGAEALLRWTHPTRGNVPPDQFISIAEDSGLILPIGEWVLREACTQARGWLDAGLPQLAMAVNVSAVQFRSEVFLGRLFDILAETRFDPSCLELEVTESFLMKRVEFTASTLQTLREHGITIAVDDFGTGYSSLNYLRKFPLDALKIDQSFVREVTTGAGEATIVNAIINMCQALGLKIIAEGVETAGELAFLQAQNCEEAQGFYFSRPVPAKQFARLIEEEAFLFSKRQTTSTP